jgi:hypothetical protein
MPFGSKHPDAVLTTQYPDRIHPRLSSDLPGLLSFTSREELNPAYIESLRPIHSPCSRTGSKEGERDGPIGFRQQAKLIQHEKAK